MGQSQISSQTEYCHQDWGRYLQQTGKCNYTAKAASEIYMQMQIKCKHLDPSTVLDLCQDSPIFVVLPNRNKQPKLSLITDNICTSSMQQW